MLISKEEYFKYLRSEFKSETDVYDLDMYEHASEYIHNEDVIELFFDNIQSIFENKYNVQICSCRVISKRAIIQTLLK